MMTRFSKIHSTIFKDDRFKNLSSDSVRLFYIYLLSNRNCNVTGVFELGLAQIEDEYGTSKATSKKYLAELESVGLAFCEDGWISFNRYLRWNAPATPKHAQQVACIVNELVKAGVPRKSLCGLLAEVKPVLAILGYKDKEGVEHTFWDSFKKSLDAKNLAAYLGGDKVMLDCFEGKCTVFSKDFARTSEVLGKDFGSTSEGLRKDIVRTSEDSKKKEVRSKKEAEEEEVRKASSSEMAYRETEISCMCANGCFVAVEPAAVRSCKGLYPAFDEMAHAILMRNLTEEGYRPADQDAVTEWFMHRVQEENARRSR